MNSLLSSRLYDQNTFYPAFEKDMRRVQQNVLIESPFITTKRFECLLPILRRLRARGVQFIVNTRRPEEHEGNYHDEAVSALIEMHKLGIVIIFTGKLHHKLAIIDGEILWEGSLNILSQSDSCEIMRRSVSVQHTYQMARFIGVSSWL